MLSYNGGVSLLFSRVDHDTEQSHFWERFVPTLGGQLVHHINRSDELIAAAARLMRRGDDDDGDATNAAAAATDAATNDNGRGGGGGGTSCACAVRRSHE